MAWHLKDRELEKKLIAIDPDFVGNLQKSVKYHEGETTIAVGFGDGLGGLSRFVAEFRWGELEEVPEYNRHDWNKFPAVKPPYNMMMRIEMYNGLGFAGFFKHFIEGDQWCYADGSPMPKAYSNNVKRYRPWCED